MWSKNFIILHVTPCVGVWIEIRKKRPGLLWQKPVTPCVGVWIEIDERVVSSVCRSVTPCVGVWIEIIKLWGQLESGKPSLPAWECGLKSSIGNPLFLCEKSLPAWECGLKLRGCRCTLLPPVSHSLRGSVD